MDRNTSILIVLNVLMVALIALSMSGALTSVPGPATTTAETAQATNTQ